MLQENRSFKGVYTGVEIKNVYTFLISRVFTDAILKISARKSTYIYVNFKDVRKDSKYFVDTGLFIEVKK